MVEELPFAVDWGSENLQSQGYLAPSPCGHIGSGIHAGTAAQPPGVLHLRDGLLGRPLRPR